MMGEASFDRPLLNKPLVVVAVAVVLAGGGWYYWQGHRAPPQPAAAPVQPAASAVVPEAVEHPVPDAPSGSSSTPLPALADSDMAVNMALIEAGGAAFAAYLVPDSVVRHLVVTIDNLPRQKVALDKRPVAAVPGSFVVSGDELHATLDGQNFQRYAPLLNALRDADMQRLAAVYLRFYPLFQKAYQDLGYPNGYFNDRLVQVIDVLLATPQRSEPVDLIRPNVMYVFADPALEFLPAGQKVLIRMGPENAAAVKAKLKELRSLITAAPPKR